MIGDIKDFIVMALLSVGAVLAGILGVALYLSVFLIPIWLTGSIATSLIKKATGECRQVYGIEKYHIQGDWFCNGAVKK